MDTKQKVKEYKLNIRVPEEFYQEFKAYAARWGMTLNQLGNMSVQTGYKAVVRALEPEKALTPDQYAAIIEKLHDRGVVVGVSDLPSGETDGR